MINEQRTPLYDALIRHSHKTKWSFHVPGHKNGAIGFGGNQNKAFASVLPIDVTELTGLDDLHEPSEAIQEAQALTASLYGVNSSYFLVGGSTAGNLVMLLSAFQENDVVFVQRNCHKSVLNGLELAGLRPVFLSPGIDPVGQFATGLTLEVVKEGVRKFPAAKGIMLTNPNYYGMSVDLKEIIPYLHENGLVVLVDEAHGAHFGRDGQFPESALEAGADMVVHSAHKTLPAMTMGAYLHFNSFRIDEKRVKHYLQALQSSSPSYPIMASLDLARAYLASLTPRDFNEIKKDGEHFRKALNRIPQLNVLPASAGCLMDPLKVTVQSTTGLTGYELQEKLEEKGIFTELADPMNVLFVLPLGRIPDLSALIETIQGALSDGMFHKEHSRIPLQREETGISALAVSYKEMLKMESAEIWISHSSGHIAAQSVIPYPPGIPLIAKGERITDELVKNYQYLLEHGARFQGGQGKKINVYAEQKEE